MTFRALGVAGFHDVHAVVWGRRDSGRAVLCVHGYSGNARDFDDLALGLSHAARVTCIDVAGRGASAWLTPLEYHFGQFLADIRMLLARERIAEVDFVGTSMGGILGMLMASQASSPIRRLVMNDVGAFVPAGALELIGRNLEAPAVFASLAEVEAHLRHTHREWGPIDAAQWKRLARHGARRVDGGYALHYDPQITRVVRPMPYAAGVYFWDAWYRVRCPVMLLRGEHSQVLPADVARAMVRIHPATRVEEIAGVGHVPSLMDETQVGLVREFLQLPEPAGERRTAQAVSFRARHEPFPPLHPSGPA